MTKEEIVQLLLAERARFEKICGRHSAIARRDGREDIARALDRLGDAVTACGNDGEAPLRLICGRCCYDVGTVPQDGTVPPCSYCDGVLTATVADDL